MVNIDEINGEISKLESQPATFVTIEKLAWLYIVRDHLTITPVSVPTVTGTEIPKGDSEFMQACSGKSISQVMAVMDELMDALQVIQPRLYDAVMNKLV